MTNDKRAGSRKKFSSSVVITLLTLLMIITLMAASIPVVFADNGDVTGDTQPTDTTAPTETAAPADEPQPTDIPAGEPLRDISDMETTKVNGRECVDGEIIVKFKNNITDMSMARALDNVDSAVQQELPMENLVVTDVPEGETVESFIETMEVQPGVEYAQPNYIYHVDRSVNDPYASPAFQWHLRTIGVFDAWDVTMGSSSIKVAVVDTGIDLDHPEFAGKIYAQYDYINKDSKAQDDEGHGTHVAGIIAATANNAKGVAGVAPGVKLIAVKVLDSGGYGTSATCSAGIKYAADHGADVINMSFGGDGEDTLLTNAVNYAVNAGTVCVAAAGNDGTDYPSTPSDIEVCISVTATDENDKVAEFSNYGSSKDISAPGVAIYSTYNPDEDPDGQSYGYMDGTSMACPVVSGVAALVLSVNPNLSVAQVKDILYSTAVDLGADGKDDYYGYGRVNAAGAVYKAAGRNFFDGGTGTPADPYLVATPEQLNAVRYFADANFKMTGDIDMSAATSSGGKYYYSGFGWSPIEALNGSFDGNNKTISGLNINNENGDYIGMFGRINTGAEVRNLNMANSRILGQENVGGITGDNEGAISYCNSSGSITGTNNVGGIAGECIDGTIIYSANSADISGESRAGGIAGRLEGSARWCSNTGQIRSEFGKVGGIAGYIDGFETGEGSVQECYNTGKIASENSVEADQAGGIAGYCIVGSISDCFNMGTIDADNQAGGIAGYCGDIIYRCYNVGNKGILGFGFVGSAPVNCYYLQSGAYGSFGTPKTEEQMRTQAAFTGFEFTSVWQIEEGKRFPTLRQTPFASVNTVSLPDTLKIKLGGSAVLTPVFSPANPSIKDVTWVSSDISIATVSDGRVTLLMDGTATITVTTKDGGLTDTCEVSLMREFTINASSGNTAYGTVTGGRDCDEGSSVTLTAKPNVGYRFVRWTENSSEVSTSAVYTFTATENRTLTAEFAPIGTPSITSAVSADYDKARLSWSAIEGAAGYELWRATSAKGTYTNIYTASDTTYTNTGLKSGTTYYYKIKAYCVAGTVKTYSSLSAYASVRPVPAAPASCSASEADYDSIKVSWSSVPGASGYMLYRAASESGTYSKIATTSKTYYTNNSVGTGTAYYYKVRAYRSSTSIYSGYSPVALPVATSLKPVENVTAKTYYPTSIKISWNAVPGRTGYEIWHSLTGDKDSFTLHRTTTSTYYYDTGLTVDQIYYYQVRAYRTVSGKKVYNNLSTPVNDTAKLFKVTNPKAVMYSVTSNKISWSSVTGASGYEVSRCDAGGKITLAFPTTGYTYFYDNTITPGQTYYYIVRAYRRDGIGSKYGPYSDIAAAEGKVGGVSAVSYTITSNKIAWNAVSGRDGYEIWRSLTPNDEDFVKIVPKSDKPYTSTSYIDTGLTIDTTYYYKVRAYDTVGGERKESAFSDVRSAKPSLKAVTGAKAARYNSTKIKLTWYSVPSVTGYQIERSTTGAADSFTNIMTTTNTSTSYYDGGLIKGTKYYYRIRAYNYSGGEMHYGEWSKTVSATP